MLLKREKKKEKKSRRFVVDEKVLFFSCLNCSLMLSLMLARKPCLMLA